MTFDSLLQHLQELRQQGKSLRQIAKEDFGGKVNHAVIQRCLMGQEPVKAENRKALGLPLFAERNLGRDSVTGQFVSLKKEK